MWLRMWLHMWSRVWLAVSRDEASEMAMRTASLSAIGRAIPEIGDGRGAAGSGPMSSSDHRSNEQVPISAATKMAMAYSPRVPYRSDHAGQLESGQRVHLKSDVYSFG